MRDENVARDAATMRDRWTEVDQYFTDLLVPTDPSLEQALRNNAAWGLPAHDVSALQGKLLYLLARVRGARTILELGALGGYSTIWLARAVPDDGRVVTLEASAQHAEVARANVAQAGLASVVEVRVGPALETLPSLVSEGASPFDMVFLDADKRHNPEYLEWSLALSHPGTLLVADNVVREGAVIHHEASDAEEGSDPDVRGIRRFTELLAADPRVSATAIQTVGAKGYDGFALALVEEP
jgi:predicted O-methyltransferase YrrM